MNFDNFSGNETLKNSLESLESHNRMPHAVILNGGTSESRSAVAHHLAKWAVCKGENKPCHRCKECISAEAKSHSDIFYAETGGKTNIYKKESIDYIIEQAYIKPNQADRKVFVFEECDNRLTQLAQNAILKTLEEPPQDIVFILTCENSRKLLNTIRSRATAFNLENKVEINEEALETAKEIALGIICPQEYELLKVLNKLATREKFVEAMETVIFLLRDGLAFSVNSQPVTDSEIAKKLCKRLTKSQYLKLIEISKDALVKVSQNASLKLLSTWLCGEYRRISWQR